MIHLVTWEESAYLERMEELDNTGEITMSYAPDYAALGLVVIAVCGDDGDLSRPVPIPRMLDVTAFRAVSDGGDDGEKRWTWAVGASWKMPATARFMVYSFGFIRLPDSEAGMLNSMRKRKCD